MTAAAAVGLPLAGMAVVAGPAAATPSAVILYAYAGGGATSPSSCPKTATVANQCTLTEALGLVSAGEIVGLASPNGIYYGNFVVNVNTGGAASAVTIQPAPGIKANSVALDGDSGVVAPSVTCPTSSCDGPVLSVEDGGYVNVRGVTIQDGQDASGSGGGILVDSYGTAGLYNDTVQHNTAATGSGGGAEVGVYGALAVWGSRFTDNSANGPGGAIDNATDTIGNLTVRSSTFTGNSSTNSVGGAISSGAYSGQGTATISASTFTSNTAYDAGGAVSSGDEGSDTLTVVQSSFVGNSAPLGGAIDNAFFGYSPATITRSTFDGNSATGGSGGAINNMDGPDNSFQMTVGYSTFYDNTATNGGGALENDDYGILNLMRSTLDSNGGTAAVFTDNGYTYVAGTIVADSAHLDCANLGGYFSDWGYNYENDASTSCGFTAPTDITGGSPELNPLALNGGQTQTMQPTAGSVVIGAIPHTTKAFQDLLCPGRDQNKVLSGTNACSIGSVNEATAPPL